MDPLLVIIGLLLLILVFVLDIEARAIALSRRPKTFAEPTPSVGRDRISVPPATNHWLDNLGRHNCKNPRECPICTPPSLLSNKS